jgi:hypothetical protein
MNLLLLSPQSPGNQRLLWSRVPGFLCLALHALHEGLSIEDADTLALRVIENAAPGARLHLVPGAFPHGFFARYRRLLGGYKKYYYRFEHEVSPLLAGAIFQFVSSHFDDFDAVVARDDALLSSDRASIDRSPGKWRLVRYRCTAPDTDTTRERRLLYWNMGALEENPDILFRTAQRVSSITPRIRFDVVADHTDGPRRRRIALYPHVRVVRAEDLRRTADRPLYDAIIAEQHPSPDWPIAAGFAAAPMLLVRIAPGRTSAMTMTEVGLEIVSHSAERAAAVLADAILRLYEDEEWSDRLWRAVLARARSRYGDEAFASMVATAFA